MDKIKVKDSRMYSLIYLYDIHTNYFARVIAGISDKDVQNRLNTKANHIAWITGSLVHERFEIANALGIQLKQTSDELFKNHKGIQDNIKYPSLTEFKKDWETISPVLRNALSEISEAKLNGKFDMGGEQMTYFDLIAFITYREASCIGQIALYRRLLGYEAMKYD